MRRTEIQSFILVTPTSDKYDFTFLAPCPSSGLMVQGTADDIVTPASVQKLIEKLKQQKAIVIDQAIIEGADHFFEGKLDEMIAEVDAYLDKRLG